MKNLFSALSLICSFSLFSQCPTTGLTLSNQAAIDNFSVNYPGCTVLPVDLIVNGTNITNLNGLSQITAVQGAVEIRNNPQLISLSGFSPAYAASDFIIRSNPLIPDLNALANLDTIGGEVVIRSNNNLTDITGLGSLVKTGLDFIVRDNALLTSLNGLSNLKVINGLLEITENNTLTDISSLSNLDSIYGGDEGAILIEANPLLTSLNGLGNPNTAIKGDVTISNNGSLSYCSVNSICNFILNPPVGTQAIISLNETGCNTIPEIQSQCMVTGIQQQSYQKLITVMPNPATTFLDVENGFTGEQEFLLTNLMGETVMRQVLLPGKTRLSISHLPMGVYFMEIGVGRSAMRSKLILQ